MIIEVGSPNNARIRIWIDEVPNIDIAPSLIRRSNFQTDNFINSYHNLVCIEAFVPMGGSYYTGILGASFEQADSFSVTTFVTELSSKPIYWTYSAKLDTTYIGLPSYLADSVLEAVTNMNEHPKGVLEIKYGAYSEVGSAPIFFKFLTQAVLYLIVTEKVKEDDIMEILRNFLLSNF